MEGYFKREKNKNYLVFDRPQTEKNYKYKMFEHYQIKGFLICKSYYINNSVRLQYDISSMQSLECICEKKQLTQERFERLLQGTVTMFSELNRFFLNADDVCFQPEYIYMDMEKFQPVFCYYPDKQETGAEQGFHQLSEYLINHLDYEDKQLIEKGYELYRLTSQDNYSIEKSIQKVLTMHLMDTTEEDTKEELWEEAEEMEYPEERTEEKISEGRLWNSLFGRWKNPPIIKEERFERNKEEILEESITELEELEETYGHTVLIKEDKGKPIHYLVALSEGGYEDFSICKYPFVLGKGREWVDGLIPHELISRIHAQLEEEEGAIFLTDLNSTNGTFVNEQQMQANETVQLSSGDVIGFAEVYYRFV